MGCVSSEHPDAQQATSFGQAAGAYERGRPGYPAQAVEWMLPPRARTVADIGAGTGKLSSALAATGRRVIAVDPDQQMLDALHERYPDIDTRLGTGESIPLDDESVDVVTFAQAWHWVDPVRASREVARLLVPGGVLGLIWNIRDERVPWVAELSQIMKGSAAEQLIAEGGPTVAEPFGPLESRTFDWRRRLAVGELVDMASSRSYLITATAGHRERVLRQVRALAEREAAGDGQVTLPYVTYAYRAVSPMP